MTTPDSPAVSGRASVPQPGGSAADRRVGRAAVRSAPPATSHQGGYGGGYGGDPPGYGGGGPALVGPPRRKRRKLLAVMLTLLLVVLLGAGGLWLYTRSLDNNMGRMDVFSEMSGDRPVATGRALNVLVLGTDSRDPDAVDTGDIDRADTIMLMHVPASRDQAYLISIPRDLWVYVPPSPDGSAGDHEAKINAATTFGGVPLMVETVEGYTGVRIDNVMLLDFAGFVEVTDALGGVDMHIDQTIESIHGDHRVFEEGNQHLNGEEALDYIRQRKQFADGDFSRMRNQQQFLKALMDKAASTGTLSNPGKLNAFLQTTTKTLTVDEEFSLTSVGWKLRNLRSDNLTFLTSPHAGTGSAGGQSVVFSDDEAAADLYAAVRNEAVAQWIADNPDRVGGEPAGQ